MNPRLEFPPEEMRRMGYRVVDTIVEHLSTLGEQPVGAKGDPTELLASVGGPHLKRAPASTICSPICNSACSATPCT